MLMSSLTRQSWRGSTHIGQNPNACDRLLPQHTLPLHFPSQALCHRGARGSKGLCLVSLWGVSISSAWLPFIRRGMSSSVESIRGGACLSVCTVAASQCGRTGRKGPLIHVLPRY